MKTREREPIRSSAIGSQEDRLAVSAAQDQEALADRQAQAPPLQLDSALEPAVVERPNLQDRGRLRGVARDRIQAPSPRPKRQGLDRIGVRQADFVKALDGSGQLATG